MNRQLKSNQPQAANRQRKPVAPPAYRPQPVPKVLQRKAVNTPAPGAGKPARVAAPPVYHPFPTPKILQRKTSIPSHVNSTRRSSVIQRAGRQGVNYTSIRLTYSNKEIKEAGGDTAAHGTGQPGDGQNANTTKQNAELVERLQKNRADKKAKQKAEVAAQAKAKRAGKPPTRKQASEMAQSLTDKFDTGTAIEEFDQYLLSWFTEEELEANEFRDLLTL